MSFGSKIFNGFAPRKGRLATDFRPRPSGDFPVSAFPEVRISTVLAAGTGYINENTQIDTMDENVKRNSKDPKGLQEFENPC